MLERRPDIAPRLSMQRRREFGLKRELGDARQWSGLRCCLRDPRGLRTWLRLVAIRLLWGGPFDRWVRRWLFERGRNDPAGHRRVARQVATLRTGSVS